MADILFLGAGIEAAITSTNGIDATNEHTDFPVENLLDRNKDTLNKNGASANTEIRIDLGAVRACSALCLVNTNCGTGGSYGGGTTWNTGLQHDDNWVFSSPTTASLSPNGLGSMADEALFFRTFTEASDRYWKVYRYWQQNNIAFTGTILLGVPMVFSLPYNRPITKGKQAGIDIRETKGGKRYANKRYGGRRLWTPANFSILTQAQWDDLVIYLWDASSEGLYPVLFRDTDGSLHWVRVNKGGALFWTHNVHNIWDTPLTIETEL